MYRHTYISCSREGRQTDKQTRREGPGQKGIITYILGWGKPGSDKRRTDALDRWNVHVPYIYICGRDRRSEGSNLYTSTPSIIHSTITTTATATAAPVEQRRPFSVSIFTYARVPPAESGTRANRTYTLPAHTSRTRSGIIRQAFGATRVAERGEAARGARGAGHTRRPSLARAGQTDRKGGEAAGVVNAWKREKKKGGGGEVLCVRPNATQPPYTVGHPRRRSGGSGGVYLSSLVFPLLPGPDGGPRYAVNFPPPPGLNP
ncbi:hypothetical protein GGS23DRAFT_532536 [Durotheca rogersii]|uniref:uncharacterized protein n=1 Tax=Durotheca rogersii TaxID=419775 RepID=UPI00221F7D7A|nr:uncharacterized protein GGS23DRAFT_532536 [Durotheca rogersii]KAI5863419.1 hypothetical protein GGS23DRAFT_532536 [Durotheca rogersii]